MRLLWPIDVVVFKNPKDAPALQGDFVLGREARMEIAPETEAFSRETLKALARLLVYENTAGLPKSMETALIDLVSTLRTDGAHITLGDPVPEAERSHDWALLHLIITKPDYLDRAHILLTNLQQSGDMDAACRNAFQKSAAQINQEADDYLKAGNFAPVSISGRAINVRYKKLEQLDRQDVLALHADLLMAAGSPDAAKAYSFGGPRAAEGLGLLALKDKKREETGCNNRQSAKKVPAYNDNQSRQVSGENNTICHERSHPAVSFIRSVRHPVWSRRETFPKTPERTSMGIIGAASTYMASCGMRCGDSLDWFSRPYWSGAELTTG